MSARLVIAGAGSGVGKTSIVVGLVRALQRRGLRVAVCKSGPDYLDPTYHARASGRAAPNLDAWMMGRDAVRATFARVAAEADLTLIEGAMGLFDGASAVGPEGSTAELAGWLEAPVVVVLDAGGMARTFAALAEGLTRFDPALPVAGFVANRVGSPGHTKILADAMRGRGLLLGGIPRNPALAFPERHLGLRTADEIDERLLDAWGEHVAGHLDLDALLAMARAAPPFVEPTASMPSHPRRCRLGLAFDAAFHFYYDDNLRRLEALGAELIRFSPMHDARPPACDGLVLGGGYPEVHAAALAGNESMRAAIRGFSGPIYAECGGLMYLSEAIVDAAGRRHAMVGLVPATATVHDRLQALGYVEVETQTTTPLGEPGTRFRGHQFRYSELRLDGDVPQVYRVRKRRGRETFAEGYAPRPNVLASYVHVHFASNPGVAAALVDAAARGRA